MSRELYLSYPGSNSVYALIRRVSDDAAWNGAAFEVWANGNIGTYDIPLTSRGGDAYDADFPTSIAVGDYTVYFYEQAGADPATTDLLLNAPALHWNGSAASSTSDISLDAYALTDLDGQKRHMGITASTYDTKLTDLINQVSAKVESITGVKFKARDWRQRLTGKLARRVCLKHFPVQHVTRISYGTNNAISLNYAGTAIMAQASVYQDPENPDAGGVRLTTMATTGVETVSNFAFAAYPATGLLATAISLIAGWTATLNVNVPTGDLHPTGGCDAMGRTVYFTYPINTWQNYSIDNATGVISFDERGWWWAADTWAPIFPRHFPVAHMELHVRYRAGYETIPQDVAMVCRELVKEFYYMSVKDTSVDNLKLGPYQVQFKADHEASVRARLAKYIDWSKSVGAGLA